MWSSQGISSARIFRMSRSVLWTLRASQDCLSTVVVPRPAPEEIPMKIYNSATHQKEDFRPIEEGKVRMLFEHGCCAPPRPGGDTHENLQQRHSPKRGLPSHRGGQGPHVRVRPHRLRQHPHRQRPHLHQLRRDRPAGLCPVEGRQARRAFLEEPVGRGPSRMAHRVRRHGAPLSGHAHRHSRRRLRPCLPASRERVRPGHLRLARGFCQHLDAHGHVAR